MSTSMDQSRIKRAELLSSVGAGVLGAGIALLFSKALGPYATPILLVGLVSHAWGMFQKHKFESGEPAPRVWWADALYWLCWASLALLLAIILVR